MQASKLTTTSFIILISFVFSFSQDITLNTQADLDAFDTNTTIILGNLTIRPETSGVSDIWDLSNLSNLNSVSGNLEIRDNSLLSNVGGLSNLNSIGGDLEIRDNIALSDVDGFSNLNSIGGGLGIGSNNVLSNVNGFSNLNSIGEGLGLYQNHALLNVDGFSNLNSINSYLSINKHYSLSNINGFSNLSSIGGYLMISQSNTLSNIDGFSNLNSIGGHLYLSDNYALLNVDGFSNLTYLGDDLSIRKSTVLSNVDGFSNLTSLDSSLIIYNNDILPNIDGFSNLTAIGKSLSIQNNHALPNVDGFSNLNSIGNSLFIWNNSALSNVDGFSNLNSIPEDLLIIENNALPNIDGFSNLDSIVNTLSIRENNILSNIDGFSNLTYLGNLNAQENSTLPDLDGLANLTYLGGLYLQDNHALLNINSFSNIDSIASSLYIQNNDVLSNLDGLSNLTHVGNSIYIRDNDTLPNVDGLSNLTYVGNSLHIEDNHILSNIDGFSNLNSIGSNPSSFGANLNIMNNDMLPNVNGFSSLNSVGNLYIKDNDILLNVHGFSNLNSINNLNIQDNQALTNCCGIQNSLLILNAIGGSVTISNNPMACDNQATILDQNCSNNLNIIEGNIFLDNDANCSFDQGDIFYENIIIQAESPEYTYTTVTDSLGDYKIYLDTGSYEVIAYMANPYTQACTPSFFVDILDDTVSDSFNFEFPTIVNTDCPYLEVDISTWALRECFDNNYHVQYCNSGTVDAVDAYIELELENILSIASSSIPFTGPDMNNIYTFDIGTVNIGDCGGFNLNILLPCDTLNTGEFLGKTFCINAHIYPDSICSPPLDIWDGSSIQVTGECDQDSIRFRVKNTGSGDMLSDKTLQVFEDQIMFIDNPFQLQSGEEMILSYFANGSTFRLDAEQSDGHPGNSNPSVAIEGCGTGTIFSLGFINQFPQDDRDVFVSSECREVTGSYDPNDKQAFPVGYGEEHFIEKNTDIEYLIRFQNTGTDTAFTVVITDEISPLFDITTIQPGASSHPYVFEIDSVVRFTFNDILLVDSLTNEAESHGFVKFKISQQADLANGTLLENTAKIYFDFNAPIITNTTFHTIGENFVTIDLIDGIEGLVQISSIKAYPNPFSDVIHFELDGNVFEDIVLSVFDVNGRQVTIKNYNSSTFQFDRENLNSGVYFYTISSEGIDIANGKMILR